jgi:hypothetical protein
MVAFQGGRVNCSFKQQFLRIRSSFLLFISVIASLAVLLTTGIAAQTQRPLPYAEAARRPAPADTIITEYSPPPDSAAKSTAYRGALHLHYFGDTFYGFVVLLLILWWRLGAKYRDWAERVSRRRFMQVLIFAPLLLLTLSILDLPTSVWDQSIELKFGRSVQRWGSWFDD